MCYISNICAQLMLTLRLIDWLQEIILNIDFAPTFMDLAGVTKPPLTIDGQSFKQLLNVTFPTVGNSVSRGPPPPPPAPWRTDFLVEHSGEVQETISGCPLLNKQNVSVSFSWWFVLC